MNSSVPIAVRSASRAYGQQRTDGSLQAGLTRGPLLCHASTRVQFECTYIPIQVYSGRNIKTKSSKKKEESGFKNDPIVYVSLGMRYGFHAKLQMTPHKLTDLLFVWLLIG